MFGQYVFEESSAKYYNKVLLIDDYMFNEIAHYDTTFRINGFEVIEYKDDLSFRINCEEKIRDDSIKLAVIAMSDQYIPYDIAVKLETFEVSYSNLFPKLNSEVLNERMDVNLNLLCIAYRKNYDDLCSKEQTETFLTEIVLNSTNVKDYLLMQNGILNDAVKNCNDYRKWLAIAEQKAIIDVMCAQYGIEISTSEVNEYFQQWVLKRFGSLSSEINDTTPILVSKAMEYMYDHSDKFVIIVMDGMSEFDWQIISRSFAGVIYEKTSAFAMIPTVTSISRQCLLANKYPVQLINPWHQSKEVEEFINCAKDLGYKDTDKNCYSRGYDSHFGLSKQCCAVIINDVDDIVHSQLQGKVGMYNDISLLAKKSKLADMVKRFLKQGYDVYISADHGNTLCRGVGRLMGTGVETETKSHRMLVLNQIADKDSLISKYDMIEYPKYYLDKKYEYLICNAETSLDIKGSEVMTHGGITIDEVVVPFVKFKAVDNNG